MRAILQYTLPAEKQLYEDARYGSDYYYVLYHINKFIKESEELNKAKIQEELSKLCSERGFEL